MSNIRRRIASLPPITFDTFKTQMGKGTDSHETSTGTGRSSNHSDNKSYDSTDDESVSPFQCLFCNGDFANDDIGLTANLEHMRTAHGMSIPDLEMVVDIQSFLGYLAIEVRTWHECLYCGAIKVSTMSVQSHMRDKGHCLLNLDREPELCDFWERPPVYDEMDGDAVAGREQLQPTAVSETEIRLASGRIISSRFVTPSSRRPPRRLDATAAAIDSLPSPLENDAEASPSPVALALSRRLVRGEEMELTPRHHVVRHEEMSLQGVSVQQRQALVLAEKKAQRSEAVARRTREWIYAKGANMQKFDQLNNQMKWGKQNHKLLPR